MFTDILGSATMMQKTKQHRLLHFTDDFVGKILLPVHVNGNHFVLFVADMKTGELMLLDSLNEKNIELLKLGAQRFRSFTNQCYLAGGNTSLRKIRWKPVLYDKKYNNQSGDGNDDDGDGVNCALMTIKYMECIAKNEPLYDVNFDKWVFRDFVAHELLRICPSMENVCLKCTTKRWDEEGSFQGYQCDGCRRWIHKRCLEEKYKNVDLSLDENAFYCLYCTIDEKYRLK